MTRFNNGAPQTSVEVTYYVRSSVLGAVVAEVNAQGQQKGYVYAGGQMIAKQWGGYLYWQQSNPVTGSTRSEATAGYVYADEESGEPDPLGNDMGKGDPYAADGLADYGGAYTSGGNGFDESGGGCIVDQMPRSCSETYYLLRHGLAEQCPYNNCNPRVVTNGVIEKFAPLGRDPQTGGLGYRVPIWVDDGYDDLDLKHPEQGDGIERVYTDIENKGHWEWDYVPAGNGLPELPFEMMGMGYGGVFMLAFQAKAPQGQQPKRNTVQEDLHAYDNCLKGVKERFAQRKANLFNAKRIATEAAWAAGLGAAGEGIVKMSLRAIGWKVVAVSVGLDVLKNVGQDFVSNQSAILARNREEDECNRGHPGSASFRIYGTFSRQERFRR